MTDERPHDCGCQPLATLDRDGPHRLTDSDAARLLVGFDRYERAFTDETGWDAAAALFFIFGQPGELADLAIARVALFDNALDRVGGNPADLATEYANAVAEGIEPIRGATIDAIAEAPMPFVAAAMIGEGWMRPSTDASASANDDPSLRIDSIRFLHAADIDDRQYMVQVSQYTGRRFVTIRSFEEVGQAIVGADGEVVALARIPHALTRLARALGSTHRPS